MVTVHDKVSFSWPGSAFHLFPHVPLKIPNTLYAWESCRSLLGSHSRVGKDCETVGNWDVHRGLFFSWTLPRNHNAKSALYVMKGLYMDPEASSVPRCDSEWWCRWLSKPLNLWTLILILLRASTYAPEGCLDELLGLIIHHAHGYVFVCVYMCTSMCVCVVTGEGKL